MPAEKDKAINNDFTEEEILEVMSLWKREPSYEFLLPDVIATIKHGRHGNNEYRHFLKKDGRSTLQTMKDMHLYNIYELKELDKIEEVDNDTKTFYIVKIKVPLNNRKEFIIYKPGICANKVLGGRYTKNNGNRIQSVIEVRNIHWQIAVCLEDKALYYMQERPWLPPLYSHELIDSNFHGDIYDFTSYHFEIFEERYGKFRNKIWNFNRKILDEMKNAQKRRFFSQQENNYLRIRGDIDDKECKKRVSEEEKIYKQRIKDIRKLRKRLRRDYFKKIPKPKNSDKLWDYLNGGETEFRIWNDTEEKLFDWIKFLLSFEKDKIDKYKNKPEVIFQKTV